MSGEPAPASGGQPERMVTVIWPWCNPCRRRNADEYATAKRLHLPFRMKPCPHHGGPVWAPGHGPGSGRGRPGGDSAAAPV